jgi:hypothetical protein
MRSRVVAAMLASAACLAPAGAASASTGPAVRTPREVGYTVTGAHFTLATSWLRLPDASRFASELGRLGVTAQFWSSKLVIDITAIACTDATCRPGGKPARRRYSVGFVVYKRQNHALVCSTSVAGPRRCRGAGPRWAHASLPAGQVVNIGLDCSADPRCDFVDAYLGRYNYDYDARPGSLVREARIGLQLGTTPWDRATYRALSATLENWTVTALEK